jgi:hypothetical protein
MKNSNDTIGNRTRDLPVCSAVPQPTAPQFRVFRVYFLRTRTSAFLFENFHAFSHSLHAIGYFHFLSNISFINYPTIRRCTVRETDSVVKINHTGNTLKRPPEHHPPVSQTLQPFRYRLISHVLNTVAKINIVSSLMSRYYN